MMIIIAVPTVSNVVIPQVFGVSTSATMSYSVSQSGSIYTYTVDLTNTSPSGFYVNGILFGAQFNNINFEQLDNIVVISIPTGWDFCEPTTNKFLECQLSGQIAPGDNAQFVFTSTTPPSTSMIFGVSFLNNGPPTTSGYLFNGIALLKNNIPVGGSGILIDANALLLAGVQGSALWMIPVIVLVGAGITIFKLKRKVKSKQVY